jgi:phenylacetate 2-hydroxylase
MELSACGFASMAFGSIILGLALAACVYALSFLRPGRGPPAIPIFGSFFLLGKGHAQTFKQWSERYGELYKVHVGNNNFVPPLVLMYANTRTVGVLKSMKLTQKLFVHQSHSLMDRPTFHTFHGILSKTSGYTLGTSPWRDRTKSARKAAAVALNKPAVQRFTFLKSCLTVSYMPLIDGEVTRVVCQLYESK